MKPQNLLFPLFLIIFLHFQPIKTENPIIGTWEFQHLDQNNSFLCCPFNTMIIKDDSKTDSLYGKSENFKAVFNFYSDSDKRCQHLIQPTVPDGLLIFKSYGSPNQTQTLFKYYDENQNYYSYQIYFTVWNQSQTLSVEYAKNWTTKGKVCEYTMTRKNLSKLLYFSLEFNEKIAAISSAKNFFMLLPVIIIVIMGIFFTFRKDFAWGFRPNI